MFNMSSGTKEKLLAYMKCHGIADQIPSPVIHSPHKGHGYKWNLAFFSPEQIAGYEHEVLHTVEGIDFVIDCSEVFLDDLRERTLVATDRGFEFKPPSQLHPKKDSRP
jgi:hypothetical protein